MNGAIMKSTFKTCLISLLLIITPVFVAKAQDTRIQLGSLDHLAAKASQTVDVNVDERLMKLAARMFSDKDEDEKEVKKLIEGLKGIYVKSFEFETEGQFAPTDLEPIRTQLRGAGWTRMVNVVSKKEGNLEVYLQFAGEMINGLAVLHTDDKELTVVNIVGPVNLDKLAQLEGQMGIPDFGIETSKPKKKTNEQ
jgi:hypothetical protein